MSPTPLQLELGQVRDDYARRALEQVSLRWRDAGQGDITQAEMDAAIAAAIKPHCFYARLAEAQAATASPSGFRFAVTSNWVAADPTYFSSAGTVTINVLVAGWYRIDSIVMMTGGTVNQRLEAALLINGSANQNSRLGANAEGQASHRLGGTFPFASPGNFSVQASTNGSAYQGSDFRFCQLFAQYLGPT